MSNEDYPQAAKETLLWLKCLEADEIQDSKDCQIRAQAYRKAHNELEFQCDKELRKKIESITYASKPTPEKPKE